MVETIASPLLWVVFSAVVVALLALDLGVFHKRAHAVGMREAAIWSAVWVGLSLLLNLGLWMHSGPQRGMEFLTGYLIEKALSVDNLFVFMVLFQHFRVPPRLQHRVLFWGIVGAVTLRAVFVFAGAALLTRFHWMVYVFGGFLVLTGVRLLRTWNRPEEDPTQRPVVRWLQRRLPFVPDVESGRFFTRANGRRVFTTLFLVLLTVEITDVVFAVDSIPAIFAVTRDPFIVYTSNIMAILGLRALYFLLAGMLERWRFLKVGLALVLVFVGAKMLASEVLHVPIGLSLAVVATLIVGSGVLSALRPAPVAPRPPVSP